MRLTSEVLEALTPDLIERLNQSGPRYTSYPTVPNWQSGQFANELQRFLQQESLTAAPLSLYVHLPFCRRLCTFCGCNKHITNNRSLMDEYLDALTYEVRWVASQLGERRSLAQVHFGGGTPTYLTVTQLQRVWQAITEHFEIAPEAELALEVHPGVTQRAQLAWLAEVGFHRISLGVQDLNPEVQQAINRFQTAEQTWQTLNDARELGFQSVNIDLVYGLPHQTAERFAHTLNEVVQMRPERLAVYSFAYIPGLFRTHERAIHATDLPSTADKLSLHLQAIRTFTSAGYEMIGMDHYAVPEDELALAAREHTLHRNFMGYTTLRGLSQLGVGVSAISDFGNGYFQNEKELTRYLEHWQQQQPVPVVHKALDKDDCLRREVIETLMCHGRLEFEPFETRYHVRFREYFAESLHALQPFVRDGLLQEEAAALQVKPLGQLFLRNLAAPFDRYLGQAAAHYSQTV